MTTTLRTVLQAFEAAEAPLSLGRLAADLKVSPAMLEGMIEFWVRKGRLRETGSEASACTSCGHGSACPLVIKMPRRFELAIEGAPPAEFPPPCAKSHCS